MDTAVVSQVGGGDYSWSKKGQVPTAGGKDSLVIYSYGDGNTYLPPHYGWTLYKPWLAQGAPYSDKRGL